VNGHLGVSHAEIIVRHWPGVWQTNPVTSGLIIIGRRVGT
jgi:hypothetical protein